MVTMGGGSARLLCMKRFCWSGFLFGGLFALAGITDAADLKAGDAAPDFSLKGSDGKTYKLSSFKGKPAVVIAWFPKAFTGG